MVRLTTCMVKKRSLGREDITINLHKVNPINEAASSGVSSIIFPELWLFNNWVHQASSDTSKFYTSFFYIRIFKLRWVRHMQWLFKSLSSISFCFIHLPVTKPSKRKKKSNPQTNTIGETLKMIQMYWSPWIVRASLSLARLVKMNLSWLSLEYQSLYLTMRCKGKP